MDKIGLYKNLFEINDEYNLDYECLMNEYTKMLYNYYFRKYEDFKRIYYLELILDAFNYFQITIFPESSNEDYTPSLSKQIANMNEVIADHDQKESVPNKILALSTMINKKLDGFNLTRGNEIIVKKLFNNYNNIVKAVENTKKHLS